MINRYPRVPGHEIISIVDAVGAGVAGWSHGQPVGVGWHGGNCGYRDACCRGDAFACETVTQAAGVTSDQDRLMSPPINEKWSART